MKVNRTFKGCLVVTIITTIMLLASLITVNAASQDWKPDRPIRMITKYSAGGGTDVLLRTLAKAMEKEIGQKIICSNMTGGVGSIATKYVYDQPADGYTWLGFGNLGKHIRPMNLGDLAAWRDFNTFLVGNSLGSWSVLPNSSIKSFEDFIQQAKANPGKIRVATDGKGGLWHEIMSYIVSQTGIKVNIVTYDGGAPATLACLQGEVEVVHSGLHEQIEFIKAGKLRNLAQFSDEDIEVAGVGTLKTITKILPQTKSMAPMGSMYGIGLRRDVPKPVLMKIKKAVMAGLQDKEFDEMLKKRFLKKTFLYGKEVDKKAAQLEVTASNLFDAIGISQKTAKDLGLPADKDFEKWWPPKEYKPSVVD